MSRAEGSGQTFDPFRASVSQWSAAAHVAELWWTRQAGMPSVRDVAASRVRGMVSFARARSAFYGRLYRDHPDFDGNLCELPVVHKADLMAAFDDWVTDPEVTRAGVEAFLAEPHRASEPFLGRYAVWTSSGTAGAPGIYLHDEDALAVYDALLAVQMKLGIPGLKDAWRIASGQAKAALIAATRGHFAAIATWERIGRTTPWFETRSLDVDAPIRELVAALNRYRPDYLASYPTVLSMLADEARSGRLKIAPSRLWSGGENLSLAAMQTIQQCFGAEIINEYGASECLSIAHGCREGWLHVNADWVVLEAVDEHYLPVAPGVASHTVLLTNLSNRIQPMIRYDLGDSIVIQDGPCGCGNVLPSIRVQGRADDILVLEDAAGRAVPIAPMALSTLIEDGCGVSRFQVEQKDPRRLSLRLGTESESKRKEAWSRLRPALVAFFQRHGLPDIEIELDPAPPRLDARSGKLRHIVRPAAAR